MANMIRDTEREKERESSGQHDQRRRERAVANMITEKKRQKDRVRKRERAMANMISEVSRGGTEGQQNPTVA